MSAVCLLSAVCLPQPPTRLRLEIGPDWYSTKLVSMKKYEFLSSQLFVYFAILRDRARLVQYKVGQHEKIGILVMLAVDLLSAVCQPQPLTQLCLEMGPD